jgi:V/A-type H+/Na+-transporting ATPase subunit C
VVDLNLADYGYVNARVRAMRSRLLTEEFFLRLVEAPDFEQMHSLLEQTAYRREINEVVLMNPDRPDYDLALNVNLVASLKKIRESTGGEPRRLVDRLLSRYDVQNIKTVLRGRKGNVTVVDIMNTILPIGTINITAFEDMAKQADVRDAIDVMASLGIKYARPLTNAIKDYFKKDEDLFVLELALDKYYYQDVMEDLRGRDRNAGLVRSLFVSEIDMRNLSTLMRIQGIGLDQYQILSLWIPGGTLSEDQFLGLGSLGDVMAVVDKYPEREYRQALETAVGDYADLGAVAFERELERRMTKQAVAMSNVDVLGIGVIIGYIWAKNNEVINLRIVLRGKLMDQPQAVIKKDLYFVGPTIGEAA